MSQDYGFSLQEHRKAVPLALYDLMKGSAEGNPSFTLEEIAARIGEPAVPALIAHVALLCEGDNLIHIEGSSVVDVSDFTEFTQVQLTLEGIEYVESKLLKGQQAALMREAARNSAIVALLANLAHSASSIAYEKSRLWKPVNAIDVEIPLNTFSLTSTSPTKINDTARALQVLDFVVIKEGDVVCITDKGLQALRAYAACLGVEQGDLVDLLK